MKHKKEIIMIYFIEKRLKSGKRILVANNNLDIENEIIPNAIKYVNNLGQEMTLKLSLGVDIVINPHDKLKNALERYREELYRYSGLEI